MMNDLIIAAMVITLILVAYKIGKIDGRSREKELTLKSCNEFLDGLINLNK
jgi:hypothetical protein